jgi:hypothetical protein
MILILKLVKNHNNVSQTAQRLAARRRYQHASNASAVAPKNKIESQFSVNRQLKLLYESFNARVMATSAAFKLVRKLVAK